MASLVPVPYLHKVPYDPSRRMCTIRVPCNSLKKKPYSLKINLLKVPKEQDCYMTQVFHASSVKRPKKTKVFSIKAKPKKLKKSTLKRDNSRKSTKATSTKTKSTTKKTRSKTTKIKHTTKKTKTAPTKTFYQKMFDAMEKTKGRPLTPAEKAKWTRAHKDSEKYLARKGFTKNQVNWLKLFTSRK